MPNYNATGLVLHRTDLGEYDRILTLYTRERGKLSAVAKGARRGSSRLSGATELFVLARMQLAVGKSLDIVTQCEIESNFVGLRTDLQRLARATYLCELLDGLTGERDQAASEEVLDLTVGALLLLQRGHNYPDAVVHAYELQLLSALGYAPTLDRCVTCGGAVEAKTVGFSPSLGGIVCPMDRFKASDAVALSQEAVSLLRQLEHADPEVILQLQPSARASAEVARSLRWFVRLRSGRALRSADFLDEVRGASPTT